MKEGFARLVEYERILTGKDYVESRGFNIIKDKPNNDSKKPFIIMKKDYQDVNYEGIYDSAAKIIFVAGKDCSPSGLEQVEASSGTGFRCHLGRE